MARLFTTGFEEQSASFDTRGTIVHDNTIYKTAGPSRNYSFKSLASNVVSTFGPAWQILVSSASANQATYAKVHFYIDTLPSAANTIMATSGSTIGAGRFTLIKLTSTGTLQLFNGASQIGSDTAALNTAQWYTLEMFVDTTPAAGSMKLHARLDGVEFAGSDSLSINSGGTGKYQSYYVGMNINAENQTTGLLYFDNYMVNDNSGSQENSWPGAQEVISLWPNAAGDNNAWSTGAGGTAGAANNYTRVNEAPPDGQTSYNTSNVIGNIDDYNVENSNLAGTETINVVSIRAYFAGSGTTGKFVVRLKAASGGTVDESTDITTSNSTTYKWTTNTTTSTVLDYFTPGTSNPWTKTDIDNAQIGVRVTASASSSRLSNMILVVSYTPGAGGGVTQAELGGFLPMMGVGA